ncbi:MAG: hypothetical protein ABH872_00335 [Candidatus Omnitrophota bacterium]
MKFIKLTKKVLTNNLWLKLISLIIAIVVWFLLKKRITGGGMSI